MHDIHPDLAGAMRASRVIGIMFAFCTIVLIVLAFVLRVETPILFGMPVLRWVLFLDAVMTAVVGWVLAWTRPAWYRRASALLHTAPPRLMRVTLRAEPGGESSPPSLTAALRPAGADANTRLVTYSLLMPAWDYTKVEENAEVEVIADRLSPGPIIIRTPHGLLWANANPGNRFKRLP
ncbi:MAG: hypothetical protein ACYDCO_08515 [Armatimonadota bacterium]